MVIPTILPLDIQGLAAGLGGDLVGEGVGFWEGEVVGVGSEVVIVSGEGSSLVGARVVSVVTTGWEFEVCGSGVGLIVGGGAGVVSLREVVVGAADAGAVVTADVVGLPTVVVRKTTEMSTSVFGSAESGSSSWRIARRCGVAILWIAVDLSVCKLAIMPVAASADVNGRYMSVRIWILSRG